MEKQYKIKTESRDGFSLLTERQMRKIVKLNLSVAISKIAKLNEDEWAKKRIFLQKQAKFKMDVKKKLIAIDSEKMMRNLLAKAVYEHSEEYNKEITSNYAKISIFVHDYRSVKFRRIHKRRYHIYSKKRLSYDILMAYKRVLAGQYELRNRGISVLNIHKGDPDDIFFRETTTGKNYNLYKYDIQIIKNWKTSWINNLRVAREEK